MVLLRTFARAVLFPALVSGFIVAAGCSGSHGRPKGPVADMAVPVDAAMNDMDMDVVSAMPDLAMDAALPDAAAPMDAASAGHADLAPADAGSVLFVGHWKVLPGDVTAAGFSGLDIELGGSFSESGRTDGAESTGHYSEPSSVGVNLAYGSPPPGISGPYLDLDTAPAGDSEWVYGSADEAPDGSTLTVTLYAQRGGMGLRWATPTVIHLVAVPVPPAPLVGSWTVGSTADGTAIGFHSLTIAADGTWSETGRTDGEPPTGNFTLPSSIPVDPDFGPPPAGLAGPFIAIDDSPDGDGEWVYGWSVSADGKTLTLTLYAERRGMGLRWATPVTIALSAS